MLSSLAASASTPLCALSTARCSSAARRALCAEAAASMRWLAARRTPLAAAASGPRGASRKRTRSSSAQAAGRRSSARR